MATFNKPQFNSVWASEGVKTPPEPAKVSQGWVVEIPPYQYANWLEHRRDAMLAHLNQHGIPVWDNITEYQANKSYVQGSTGRIYRALTTHTNANPETDVNGNWEVAFEKAGDALLKAQNLADVPNKALARQNLGIATTADYDARYLLKTSNLSDVPNKTTARSNLGLGNSAVLNVGTVANTVAAGNDSRIVNATPNTRTITAGNGLTGGGNLTANRTISLGTPSTITASSANSVGTSTHTHSMDIASFFPRNIHTNRGSYTLPGGLCIQWGRVEVARYGNVSVSLRTGYVTPFVVLTGLDRGTQPSGTGSSHGTFVNNSTIQIANDSAPTGGIFWVTLGLV